MTNLDVAGLLKTYSEKCAKARDSEHLKDIVRDLKHRLDHQEIGKFEVIGYAEPRHQPGND